jgi:uncharacterized membrane protein
VERDRKVKMKVLLGIIFFHILVILRAKIGKNANPPYISTLVITLLMVAFVMFMMYTTETS